MAAVHLAHVSLDNGPGRPVGAKGAAGVGIELNEADVAESRHVEAKCLPAGPGANFK